jgi:hypothetical protein
VKYNFFLSKWNILFQNLVCPSIMECLTYLYQQQWMGLHFPLLVISEIKKVIMKICYFKQYFIYVLHPVVYTFIELGVQVLQILTYIHKCNYMTGMIIMFPSSALTIHYNRSTFHLIPVCLKVNFILCYVSILCKMAYFF